MNIYQLSDYARAVDYKTWKSIGGCSAPNNTIALIRDDMTLGEIEDICPYTGRGFARFAVDHLKLDSFAIPYKAAH